VGNPIEQSISPPLIADRRAVVGIIGMGYVGLPLALLFVRRGFRTLGFDIDLNKVRALKSGTSYLSHIPHEEIRAGLETGRFDVTTDFSRVNEAHAILLCVPTPLTDNRQPDMSYIEGTCRGIAPHLVPGQLVVLESTTYPGTTREVMKPLLERDHLKVGESLFLGYSPEREDPGNRDFGVQDIPKVVSGLTAQCTEMTQALYSAAFNSVTVVSSCETGEATKLLENIFRSVNIAMVNELKLLFDRMGVDVWEVIEAASTKPFGFMPFYPGPGLGGHCIPIDPFYLTWRARQYELTTRFIELAGEINTNMPFYVVERTGDALNERRKAMKGSKIMVIGLAYKPNVNDDRESPAWRILELLSEKGAEVSYHDPYIPKTEPTRRYDFRLSSEPLTSVNVASKDAIIVVTDHDNIDYSSLAAHAGLIIDTRNAFHRRAITVEPERLVRA
jgi:UDP-N-acetyl-D-glucosamine dehydrogenase